MHQKNKQKGVGSLRDKKSQKAVEIEKGEKGCLDEEEEKK